MGKRRQRRLQAKKQETQTPRAKKKTNFEQFYNKHYKLLFIIPFILLALSLVQIGVQISTTGDFVSKGVSLKGGIVVTLFDIEPIAASTVETHLENAFPNADVSAKELMQLGAQVGLVIEASDVPNNDGDLLIEKLKEVVPDIDDNFSIEVTGAVIGASFFEQILKALLVAFSFMGVVVFLYFAKGLALKIWMSVITVINGILIFNFFLSNTVMTIISLAVLLASMGVYLFRNVPSFAVIFAVLTDAIITLAIVNLIGVKLSTAGIAAFLMLIGYSVDTDILLSTRVLKRREGTVTQRIFGAAKTGLTMSATTLVALGIAFFVSQSEVLDQIMLIVLIGLVVDVIITWFFNAGLLKWYTERKRHG